MAPRSIPPGDAYDRVTNESPQMRRHHEGRTIERRAGLARSQIHPLSPLSSSAAVQMLRVSPRPKAIPNPGRLSGKSDQGCWGVQASRW